MLTNKRFCPHLKKEYDRLGKLLAICIMRDVVGAKLIADNIKEDSGDFTDGFWDQKYLLPGGTEIKVEPEMKNKKWWYPRWFSPTPFCFDEMDVPFRKEKNQAQLHIVISTCQTKAFLVTRSAMNDALEQSGKPPKFKITIYEPEGGWYFSTPVNKGYFVHRKENGRWSHWKEHKAHDIVKNNNIM